MTDSISKNSGMNKIIIMVTILLLIIGVVEVYTASAPSAVAKNMSPEHYMFSQLRNVGIGVTLLIICARFIDYQYWIIFGRFIFWGGFILCLLAYFLGGATKGANRWIFGIQPAEILKLGVYMCLCSKLSKAGDKIKTAAYTLIQPGIYLALSLTILYLQKNNSMAGIFTCIVFSILFVAKANYKYLGYAILVMIPVAISVALCMPHSRARIFAYFAGEGEMEASKYQGDLALQALGNGGLWGTGVGMGVIKNGYLPESYKDVIFSVFGEEFGFIGTSILLIAFMVFFCQGLKIARNSSSRFGKYLGFALTMSIFVNFCIHTWVCTGIFPMTGQPLPFISYGGTNLIFNCVAVGILLNISRPNTGKNIKEPYMSGVAFDGGTYSSFDSIRRKE